MASADSNHEALPPALRHSGESRVRCYRSQFADVMEMRAPAHTVAAYLDRHEGWFRRCAAPMQVTALERNGYVLTLGGRRLYVSGDTGDAPQIRSLTAIDVAFVCMNTPYTMTVKEATNAVRGFKPAVVYPYH